jgi:hypothetical protein
MSAGCDALTSTPVGLGYLKRFWSHTKGGLDWRLPTPGLELEGLLPERDDAIRIFEKKGLKEYLSVHSSQLGRDPSDEAVHELSYPLARGWSDVLVVSRETLPHFAQFVGGLSASRLFVEISIPTALVLASEQLTNLQGGILKPRAIWNPDEKKELLDFHQAKNLFREFPGDFFCIHPVKLSQFGAR